MTEAGKQWVENLISHPDYARSCGSPEQRSDFWLRSFCAEVERRGDAEWERQTKERRPEDRSREPELVMFAFNSLKRELLGDE